MIDSHSHLDHVDRPATDAVAEADAAGVKRILSIGMDGGSCRATLALAEDFPQVCAAVGRHPNSATGFDDADLAELARARRPPRCVAIGETGLDYYRDHAPRADQERAFHAQIELARETGKPLVIHTRAAEDDTIATLRERAGGVARDPPLLLDARPPRRVPRPAAGGSRSPATSPTPRRPSSATRRSACPTTACSSRPTRPTSLRSRYRGKRNQPRVRRAHGAARRAGARDAPTRSSRPRSRQRRRGVRVVSAAEPRSPASAACGASAAARTASLGQNFLIDSNILGVDRARGRAARRRRRARDRGRARRALRAPRRARRRTCTSSSSTARSSPRSRDALDPFDERRRCTSPTRSTSTSRACALPPTKVVANLPYGSPRPRVLARSRSCRRRRAGSRWSSARSASGFAAAPGTAAYGVPSVLAQLPRDVPASSGPSRARSSLPVPNVDSVLVGARSHAARPPPPALRELVHAAFAHRRKALAGSLALAPGAPRGASASARAPRSSALGPSRRTRAPSGLSPDELRGCRSRE